MAVEKRKEPRDHPGQLGITEDVTKEIKEGAMQDDVDVFTKGAKKLGDIIVLQLRVAVKSGVFEERISALESVARTAAGLATDVRRFLGRCKKVAAQK